MSCLYHSTIQILNAFQSFYIPVSISLWYVAYVNCKQKHIKHNAVCNSIAKINKIATKGTVMTYRI